MGNIWVINEDKCSVMKKDEVSIYRRCVVAFTGRYGAFTGHLYRVFFLMVVSLILCRCSTGEDLEVCCQEVVLEYRYVRSDIDEYKTFVHGMRHFLFDGSGHFLREVMSSSSRTIRLLKLPKGSYTVVTIGNATPALTTLGALVPGVSRLADFKLSIADVDAADGSVNTDPLFWNEINFEVEANRRYRYVCDLSNIHCRLFVKVYWHSTPPYLTGLYTMTLDHVPADYLLSPDRIHHSKVIRPRQSSEPADRQVIHTFPGLGGRFTKHYLDEELYGVTLYGDFVTLRYTDDYIPIFRLAHDGKYITKPIDLSKAFASWGWHPDEHPEQIYRIELEIFDDGTVVVNQWAQTSVKDWEDGGTIGV